jgi:type II secretory pathway pseudopilin PulG
MYRIRTRRWKEGERAERGYTLTELAVVMSVFMIFMALAAPVMFSQINSAVRTEQRADLQQSGRAALRTLVRELRQAKALYSSSEKPSGKSEISFGTDLNGDGSINHYKLQPSSLLEMITYYVQGTTLYRGRQKGQGVPIAENLASREDGTPAADALTFTMYGSNTAFDTQAPFGVITESELNPDGAWTEPELANVTRVVVTLKLGEAGPGQQTYTADVWLRNRVVG